MSAVSATTAADSNVVSGAFKVSNLNAGTARHDLSSQWFSRPADQRFLSLDALAASVKARADRSKERTGESKAIEFLAPVPTKIEDTHKLSVVIDGAEVAPTHWSFGQLATLAGAPAAYLRKLPSQIVADALTYGMRYSRSSSSVKLYHDDVDVLAATGPDYGRIFDHEVVEAVRQIAGNGLGESRWKVPGVMDWRTMIYDPSAPVTKDTTTLFASDRDVFMFLVDDLNPICIGKARDGQDDLVFRGFYVKNSEVGSTALTIAAFYLRALCCNRIMWGVEGFEEISLRHSKYAPSRFVAEATPALVSFANGSESKLKDAVEKAKAAKIAEDKDSALEFLRSRSFSVSAAKSIFERHEAEEGHPPRSAWDFANAITAHARQIEHTDDRIEVDGAARKILDKVAA